MIEKILTDIRAEREYQEGKWGVAIHDRNAADDFSAYITQDNGNASHPETPEAWRSQMVKVASLVVAAIEAFDRNGALPARHYDPR